MSENLPILWEDKINSPELKAYLKQFGKNGYMTAEEVNQLRDAVNEMSEIQKTTFLGVAEPDDVPTGTGRGYWEVITVGPYPNHGGGVLEVDERGLITRDEAGVFKMSKVSFGFSNYASKVYIENEILSKFSPAKEETFAISDTNGNIAVALDPNGNLLFNESQIQFLKKLKREGFPTNDLGNIDLSLFELYTGGKDDSFAISDTNGNIALELDPNGNLLFNESQIQFLKKLKREGFPTNDLGNIDLSLFELYTGTDDNAFAICDKNGNIGLKLNSETFQVIGGRVAVVDTVVATNISEGNYPSDIMMFITNGQSNATGSAYTNGVVSENVLGFTRGSAVDGVVTQYDATVAKSITELDNFYGNEFVTITYGNNSQTEAAMNQFMKLITVENKKNLSDLGIFACGSNPSQGGTQIYLLNNSSGINVAENPNWKLSDAIVWTEGTQYQDNAAIYLTRFLQSVWYAKKHADSLGKTFSVPILSWIHGEAHQLDLSYKTYYDQVVYTFNLYNTLIKKITGQVNDVEFLIFQTVINKSPNSVNSGSFDSIAMAALKLAEDIPNISYSFSMLPFESTEGDYVHYKANSYALMGIYTGIQAKRLIVDGIKPKPLVPISHHITESINGGYLLSVKYDVAILPIVFDSTQPYFQATNKKRGVRTNHGFSLKKILFVSEEIPSTVLYTKSTAILAIPTRLKKNSLIIKIRVSANGVTAVYEFYQFTGDYTNTSSWGNLSNWSALTSVIESNYELLTGVANITISRDDTIVFKCSENPKGYFLKYGYEPLTDTTGGGSLRDSQNIKTFITGTTIDISNWSPMHKREL
jgi:hypothetical protein